MKVWIVTENEGWLPATFVRLGLWPGTVIVSDEHGIVHSVDRRNVIDHATGEAITTAAIRAALGEGDDQ